MSDVEEKKLEFQLKLKEVPVDITNVEGQTATHYLRELSGAQRDAFLNEIGGRIKFNAAGKMQGLKDYTDLQTGFLALCFYDDANVIVSKEVLREYPASVLEKLFEVAQKLSGLDKGAKDKAKNDLEAKNSTGIE